MKLPLPNRESSVWLEDCADGSFKVVASKSYITDFMRVLYGDNNKIIAIDPSGGPFMAIGYKVGDYKIVEIRKDLHLILEHDE